MHTFRICILAFLIQSHDTSSSDSGSFKKEYVNPKNVDHGKISGRWYAQMDTISNARGNNIFADAVVPCDEENRIVHIMHGWFPSVEECRTSVVVFEFERRDSSEGEVRVMSTNAFLGKMTIRYFDLHPTKGFIIVQRQARGIPDSYFISSRQKDPGNMEEVIKQVLVALSLDIGDFNVKSKDFGCERREEKGINL